MAEKKRTVDTAGPASDKKKALETAIAQIERDYGKEYRDGGVCVASNSF